MTHLEKFTQEYLKAYTDKETTSTMKIEIIKQLETMTETIALCSIADSLNILAGKEVGE